MTKEDNQERRSTATRHVTALFMPKWMENIAYDTPVRLINNGVGSPITQCLTVILERKAADLEVFKLED
jgi:hypothetical protein